MNTSNNSQKPIFSLSQHISNEPAASLIIQPHVLSALFTIRMSANEICQATSIPQEILLKICEAWEIDIETLHQKALEKAISSTEEKIDPDITPFETAVKHGCRRVGWDSEKFIQSYKLFRSNRQRSNTKQLRRPKRLQKQLNSNLCQMNLMEFFMLWVEHGRESFFKMGKKRRASDQKNGSSALQVCRKNHDHAYTLDNCFIATQNENMKEMHEREQPSKNSRICPVVVNGIVFGSRSEAKKLLGKSESWLNTNEGDYKAGTYKTDECRELLLEELTATTNSRGGL